MYTCLKCYYLEMLSDCVHVIVYNGCINMFGLSATSQEMLSTAQESRINPIKRHLCCVTSLSETPEFTTIGARDQDRTTGETNRGFE